MVEHTTVVAILSVLSIVFGTKNKSQADQIATLDSKVYSLNTQISSLERAKNELIQKFSSLSSAYRILSKEKTLTNFNSSVGNLSVGRGLATVVYRSSSCDYFILENQTGYIVAEWMGGNDPDVGDKVTGDFNSFGLRDFYNQTLDTDCSLWIDNYMLDKDDAMDNLKENCQ